MGKESDIGSDRFQWPWSAYPIFGLEVRIPEDLLGEKPTVTHSSLPATSISARACCSSDLCTTSRVINSAPEDVEK